MVLWDWQITLQARGPWYFAQGSRTGVTPLNWMIPKTTFCLVRPLGLEPRTCGLRVRCSAIELEARMSSVVEISAFAGLTQSLTTN